jgi:hypothetical protein
MKEQIVYGPRRRVMTAYSVPVGHTLPSLLLYLLTLYYNTRTGNQLQMISITSVINVVNPSEKFDRFDALLNVPRNKGV